MIRVCHENTSNLAHVRKCECKRLAKVNVDHDHDHDFDDNDDHYDNYDDDDHDYQGRLVDCRGKFSHFHLCWFCRFWHSWHARPGN